MQTKLEELIDLSGEHDKLCETLTHHELVRIAGGFGATDESVAKILRDAMIHDTTTATTTTTSNKQQQSQHRTENDDDDNEDIEEEGRHALQDIVNEGLAASGKFSNRNNELYVAGTAHLLSFLLLPLSTSWQLIVPHIC